MIKVASYIETIGTENFKNFLNSPFKFDILYSQDGSTTYFDGWKGKDMINWFKYTNDDNIVLEVYAETYGVKSGTNAKPFVLPHPKTIDDFINDMHRLSVQLYWQDWIDDKFEPKDYLNKDEIRNYFVNLLKKLDKSHELENLDNE